MSPVQREPQLSALAPWKVRHSFICEINSSWRFDCRCTQEMPFLWLMKLLTNCSFCIYQDKGGNVGTLPYILQVKAENKEIPTITPASLTAEIDEQYSGVIDFDTPITVSDRDSVSTGTLISRSLFRSASTETLRQPILRSGWRIIWRDKCPQPLSITYLDGLNTPTSNFSSGLRNIKSANHGIL